MNVNCLQEEEVKG
jgi:hypothetical protein